MDDKPIVERLCPDCKVPLERVKPRVTWSSLPGSFLAETYLIDIYACPRCGLVRVYDYEQRRKQEAAAEKAATPPPQPAEKAETAGDPWEDKPSGLFRRKKKDKPDWEK